MTIKAETASGLVDQRRNLVGDVSNRTIKKKKCKKLVVHRSLKTVNVQILTLQRLFWLCREVFKGPDTVPSPSDVQKLCHILGKVLI